MDLVSGLVAVLDLAFDVLLLVLGLFICLRVLFCFVGLG